MDIRELIIVPQKTIIHSGLTRAYFTPSDWRVPLPKISNIMEDPDEYSSLLFHIGLNHKGLNWKMYRFTLTIDNYSIFLYALTYCMLHTNTSANYCWQMHKNAQRLEKFIARNDIPVSINEEQILEIALDFHNWTETLAKRTITLGSLLKGFKEAYA